MKKILFYRYNSICEPDIISAFKLAGHAVDEIKIEINNKNVEQKTIIKVVSESLMKSNYDMIFTVNFYPTISEVCNIFKIPYVSWIVDCPVMELYSDSLMNEWNRIFIFDYITYEEFVRKNPTGIYYFPLGTNMEKNDKYVKEINENDIKKYSHEVSFIGSMYREKCDYNKIESRMSDYMRGYFEGLINAQKNIYGYNFVENAITDSIVEEFNNKIDKYPFPEKSEHNYKSVIAQLVVNTKIAEVERYELIGTLSEISDVSIYTGSDVKGLPKVKNCGFARSEDEMRKIFNLSKINLNITAKPIRSGLSLRIWDVLGCGGFLISNYQQEIPEYFEIGKEIETYGSKEELIEKVVYYLEHEDERKAIAKAGYEKVKKYHSYFVRINDMMKIVFD